MLSVDPPTKAGNMINSTNPLNATTPTHNALNHVASGQMNRSSVDSEINPSLLTTNLAKASQSNQSYFLYN
jgi:hypothetical protein